MGVDPEELKRLHNQGQTDASNGESKSTFGGEHGFFADCIGTDEHREKSEAYKSGEAHHRSQTEK